MLDALNHPLLLIAALGALALVVGHVAKRVVPEIVVFLGIGVAMGPEGFGLINHGNVDELGLLTDVALGAIIFLIGDRLRLTGLRGMRRTLLPVTAGQIVLTVTLVFLLTQWAGAHWRLAALLALIAAETGVLTVSATVASMRAEGRFTDHLLSGVALTNVVTAALFGMAFPLILAVAGIADSGTETLRVFAGMVLGSSLIGLVGGRVLRAAGGAVESSGEQLLAVLLTLTGVVGASLVTGGSVVVSCLVTGLYLANTAPLLARQLFDAVRVLESPIYLVFFVVAGAEVHLDDLSRFGMVGVAYVAARTLGKVGGAALGGGLSGRGLAGLRDGAWSGAALLPHAGMAIALVAAVVEHTYTLGDDVSGVVLGSLVVFELTGPVFVKLALRASGEDGKGSATRRVAELPDLDTSRTFERVLLPVGNSEALVPRLPFLLDVVSSLGAELIAVHVAPPGQVPPPDGGLLEAVRAAAEERGVTCHAERRVGERVSEVLVRTALERDVDLVMMGEPVRATLRDPRRRAAITRRTLRGIDVPVLLYPVDPSNPSEAPD